MVNCRQEQFIEKGKCWLLLDFLFSWIFGCVMILAAVPHLENPYYFLGSIYAYNIVEPGIGQVVAIVLPFLQLVVAVLLFGRIFHQASGLETHVAL